MPTVEFSIPKNTPKTALYKQSFDLGINSVLIKNVLVTIPEGHKGLAFMRAYTPGYVIIPESGSSVAYIRGDKQEKNIAVNKKLEGPPNYIYCEGYNEDVFLAHTFIIDVEV